MKADLYLWIEWSALIFAVLSPEMAVVASRLAAVLDRGMADMVVLQARKAADTEVRRACMPGTEA